MRTKVVLAALLVLSLCQTASAGLLAQLEGVSGTWSTKEGCEWRKSTVRGWPDRLPAGFDQYAYLNSSGLEGYEWSCEFVSQDSDRYGRIVAVASCTAEGDSWPDLFMMERDQTGGGWRVITKGDKGDAKVTAFPQRCDR